MQNIRGRKYRRPNDHSSPQPVLLNASRPFLVGLLEKRDIPFRKVGTHCRVLLKDVMAYKERIDQRRKASLDEITALSQEEGMGY